MTRIPMRAPHHAGIRRIIAGIVWVFGVALSTPAQNYPLTLGTQWTLRLRQELGPGVQFGPEDAALAKGNVLETAVVSRVKGADNIGGAAFTRIESLRNGKPWLEEWLRLTPQGLLLGKTVDHSTGEQTPMSPPQRLLSSTLHPGEVWDWKQSNAPVNSRTTVGLPEQVIVAAGTFSATPVRVEMTFATEGQPLVVRQTRWFSPGVGYVKQDTLVSIAGHTVSHTVLTLEKFELTDGRSMPAREER